MNWWLKFRVWLKLTLFALVTLYLAFFLINNIGETKRVSLWIWFGNEPEMPVLAFMSTAFLAGVLSTLLVRTILRTISQLREIKRKRREKEAAAIVARASKLRLREQAAASGQTP